MYFSCMYLFNTLFIYYKFIFFQDKQTAVINLPASTTAIKLMVEVGKKFSYDVQSFELIFQRASNTVSFSPSDVKYNELFFVSKLMKDILFVA